jgi:electron transport complex protein RnfE
MSLFVKEFTKGLWKDLPPFKLVLGLCPVLAVTDSAEKGFGMGMAFIFVLVFSNTIISALRKVIPPKVRIACFIVIVASLVITVELVMKAFAYQLSEALGMFIPLIVVNCIILGRAEAFASRRPVLLSIADGLGIGLGFTISLTFLGALRELFGTGMIFGQPIMWESFRDAPFTFMVKAPGAFVCLGILLGVMNFISAIDRKPKEKTAKEETPATV